MDSILPRNGASIKPRAIQVALPAVAGQAGAELVQGQPPALFRTDCQREHGQGVAQVLGLIAKQGEGAHEELGQAAAQLAAQALLHADGAKVAAGSNLERLGLLTVSGQRPQVLALGAHQVGQDMGITGIRLRP